jgi:hypothetical protein
MKYTEVNSKETLIAYLKSIKARYEETQRGGVDFIYVYDKKAYDEKKDFIPYLRISHFWDTEWYTRFCGSCEEMTPSDVALQSYYLTKG